jgi:hypothetical protein
MFRSFITSFGDLHTFGNSQVLIWQNLSYSVTCQVAPFALENGTSPADVWKAFSKYSVLIFWLEQGTYDRAAFMNGDSYVHIVVQPTDNPHCIRITVHKKESTLKFALVDSSLTVSKKIAGLIVRWTAVFANDAIRAHKEGIEEIPIWNSVGDDRLFSFGIF